MGTRKTYKANITFMPVVESINRKFALRRETCSQTEVGDKIIKSPGYMGAGTHERLVVGYGWVKRNYFFMRKHARSTAVTDDEQLQRSYFGSVSKWNKQVWHNLSVVTANQEKWEAAKADLSKTIKGVSAKGYTGPIGWSFAIGIAIKRDDQTLPATGALPEFDA